MFGWARILGFGVGGFATGVLKYQSECDEVNVLLI